MAPVTSNGTHEDGNTDLLDDFDIESGSEKDFLLEAARQAPVEVHQELRRSLHNTSSTSTSSISAATQQDTGRSKKITPVWKRRKLEAPPPQPETFRARQELLRQFTDGHDVMARGTAAPSIAQLQSFRQQVYLYGCAVGMGRHEAEIQVTWAVERFCRARQEKGLELIDTRDTSVDLKQITPGHGDDLEAKLDELRDHALRDPIDVDTAWEEVKKVIDVKDKKKANKNKRKVEAEAEKGPLSGQKEQDGRNIRDQPPQKKAKAKQDDHIDNAGTAPANISAGSKKRKRRASRRKARDAEGSVEQQESPAITRQGEKQSVKLDPSASKTSSKESRPSSANEAAKSDKRQAQTGRRRDGTQTEDVPHIENLVNDHAILDQLDGAAKDHLPLATTTANGHSQGKAEGLDDTTEFKDSRKRKTRKRGRKRDKPVEGSGAALEPQDEDEARGNYLKSNAQEDVKDGPQKGDDPRVQAEKNAETEAIVNQIHDEIHFNQSKEVREFGSGRPQGTKMQEKAAMKELESELETEKVAQDRVDTAHGITPSMKEEAADAARKENIRDAEANGTFSKDTGKTLPQLRKEEREKAILDDNGAAKSLTELMNGNDHEELTSGNSGLDAKDKDVCETTDGKKPLQEGHARIRKIDSTQTGTGLSEAVGASDPAKDFHHIASGIATPELSTGEILDRDLSRPFLDSAPQSVKQTRRRPRKSTTSPYFAPPERPKETPRKKKPLLGDDTEKNAEECLIPKPVKLQPQASRTTTSKRKKKVKQSQVTNDLLNAKDDRELSLTEFSARSASVEPINNELKVFAELPEPGCTADSGIIDKDSTLLATPDSLGSKDKAFEPASAVPGPDELLPKTEAIDVNETGATTPKSTKCRRVTKSPFFPAEKHESKPKSPRKKGGTVSCIPFPRLDAPRFGLMQELLAHDPFRLLIAVTFLIRTHGKHAIPVYFKLMEQYPTPESIVAADRGDIIALTHHLGFQNQRCDVYKKYANAFIADPPVKGRRYRTQNYPRLGAHKDIKKGEVLDDDDPRIGAFEIGHMTEGRYALDSWRMFCRDVLRGRAEGYDGEGRGSDFEPEWKEVLPQDKELRAWMRWRYLKDGLEWDPETGTTIPASDVIMAAAREGRIAWDDQGGMRIVHEDEAHAESHDSQLADDGDVSGEVAHASSAISDNDDVA